MCIGDIEYDWLAMGCNWAKKQDTIKRLSSSACIYQPSQKYSGPGFEKLKHKASFEAVKFV